MTGTLAKDRAQLKRRLRALNITQDEIAARAGCTRTYVNHYLNGRRSPNRLRVIIAGLIAEQLVAREQSA